jgi:hypothetical protein
MDGVRIDLISQDRFMMLNAQEKAALVLSIVRSGTIVVLENGLTPEEQAELIEMTMSEIMPGVFSGIEIETYPAPVSMRGRGRLSRILGHDTPPRLTVIGPANQIRTLRKDSDVISAWVSSQIE